MAANETECESCKMLRPNHQIVGGLCFWCEEQSLNVENYDVEKNVSLSWAES